MKRPKKIEKGSTLTLQAKVERVWPDGRLTISLYGIYVPITIPDDSPDIVLIEPPARKPK